jgi:predicted dehydrogenase
MLNKIDALIVDHRHGKFHLEAAIPFIKKGIPTFIDKPFCYRLEAGKKFLALAKKVGTPVTSFSSIAHSYETFDIKGQVENMGEINQVVRYGPIKLDSEYGGVFFYGAHMIQPLMYIFGDNIKKVRTNDNGKNSSASLIYENGMLATLISSTQKYGWETHIETKDGMVKLNATEDYKGKIPKNYLDMVTMFKAGVEPRSYNSILTGVAVLEALERSVNSGQWEDVIK